MATVERTPLSKRDRTLIAAVSEAIGAQVANALEPSPQPPAEPEPAPPQPWQDVVNLAPVTGADLTWTVAGCRHAVPISVMVRLTTSSTVADRSVAVEYRTAGVRYLVAGTQAVVQANGQQSYCWFVGQGGIAWPVEDAALAPLPEQAIVWSDQLAVKVWNGQIGDVLDQGVVVARFYP